METEAGAAVIWRRVTQRVSVFWNALVVRQILPINAWNLDFSRASPAYLFKCKCASMLCGFSRRPAPFAVYFSRQTVDGTELDDQWFFIGVSLVTAGVGAVAHRTPSTMLRVKNSRTRILAAAS